jgi:hypothetical protein
MAQASPLPLKRPFGLILLALFFILAPVGNILISYILSGLGSWRQPWLIIGLLQNISALDWAWLLLVFITGVSLLIAHKTAWTLALISLISVLAINGYRAVNPPAGANLDYLYYQLGLSSVVTMSGLVIAFYFRYPYLDRRSNWFSVTAQRHAIRTPVQIVAQDIFSGVTESISISGARVLVQRDMGPLTADLQNLDVIFPAIRQLRITAEIVQYAGNGLRLKFKNLSTKDKETLKTWIEAQKGEQF